MTARIEAHNAKRSERLHPMDDRKFNGDHTRIWAQVTGEVAGQLWQRLAEGKSNPDLVYPFYKRRHLLGIHND